MIEDITQNTYLDEEKAAQLAEFFRAIGDATRIRILSAISSQALNVSTIAQIVKISESGISHHVRGLRQLRLVKTQKRGKEVYYSLDDDHVSAVFKMGLEHINHP